MKAQPRVPWQVEVLEQSQVELMERVAARGLGQDVGHVGDVVVDAGEQQRGRAEPEAGAARGHDGAARVEKEQRHNREEMRLHRGGEGEKHPGAAFGPAIHRHRPQTHTHRSGDAG